MSSGGNSGRLLSLAQTGFANTLLNDRPRIGCIGLGGRRGDAHGHRSYGDILALCDVDENQAKKANDDPNIGGGKADLYGDYRKVLERADIDVVSIVTPDHWHVKIAIECCRLASMSSVRSL